MRINERTRFPHPVLNPYAADYTDGDFSVEFMVTESKTTGMVRIEYSINLTESHVEELVSNGDAAIGLYVVCRRTYYNELHPIDAAGGSVEFQKGELKDSVVLRPVICALTDIADYSAANLHDEFSEINWNFIAGNVLAIGTDSMIDVGLEKLAPMETIFNLAKDEDVPDGEVRVQLESDKITIQASPGTCDSIHTLRGSGSGQQVLLTSVYMPVIMEVLAALAEGADGLTTYRWHSVFTAKCKHLGISVDQPDLLEDAQNLLRAPLGRLLKAREFKPS